MIPHKVHRDRDDRDRNVEENDAQRNGEVEQERDQPSEVVSMLDQAGNPPAVEKKISI